MDCGSRLKLFVSKNFDTQKKFSEKIGLDSSVLSKYISGKKTPGFEVIKHFHDIGLSIDWLINGTGSMFAHNPAGEKLKCSSKNNSVKKIDSSRKRLSYWVDTNYSFLRKYSHYFGINEVELKHIISEKETTSTDIIDKLKNAGCNISWIISGK